MSMSVELSAMPEWLQSAFATRGFTQPTPIQTAVLDPELRGRDLRIASATGSGKTIALSAVLGETLFSSEPADRVPSTDRHAEGRPRVLIVAPTRELALQLAKELRTLYGPHGHRVALVLGGGSYRQECAALRACPSVLVATPGRLVDHMQRGQVHLDAVAAVALDEADQLLALGFQEELDTILAACPDQRRTIMVSATFRGPVKALAQRHQRDALRVEGTPVDAPHADIDHVGHVVQPDDQLAAITNLLLMAGEARSLIFVATRAQVADLARTLAQRGFAVGSLSGDMAQPERARALEAFRAGRVRTLVATDVAARGLDVDGIRMVLHASPPRDIEALIHRSGRTGRAGNRGRSVQLLSPSSVRRVRRMFEQAGLSLSISPVPGPDAIERAHASRWAERLEAPRGAREQGQARALLQTLLTRFDTEVLLERLVAELRGTLPCEPAVIQPVMAREPRPTSGRGSRVAPSPGQFALFEVTYGTAAGATPQRVMAIVCRRGRVQRKHIGHIQVADGVTLVEIDRRVAGAFARAAARPDARDRDVRIRPARPDVRGRGSKRERPRSHGHRPPRRRALARDTCG